jgi:hypothetical protein
MAGERQMNVSLALRSGVMVYSFLRLHRVESVVNKSDLKTQVSVMSNVQYGAPTQTRSRPLRLSPEINEFLHMLDALEGQAAAKDNKNGNGR